MFLKRVFFDNYLLMVTILSWTAAQVAKTIIEFVINRKLRLERLVGAGGMPSSHAALVSALFMGSARRYGMSSPYFAIAFVLAAIVMYDAMGVRLETGRQARVLNRMLSDFKEEGQDYGEEKKLKELVGHTPIQVISGALLGVLLAISLPVF